jgi:hypothetical protein
MNNIELKNNCVYIIKVLRIDDPDYILKVFANKEDAVKFARKYSEQRNLKYFPSTERDESEFYLDEYDTGLELREYKVE